MARTRSKKSQLKIREVALGDLEKGLLETLSNLSDASGLRSEEARRILLGFKATPFHKIYVAVRYGEVIGATTLIIEQKFIHKGGLVGHIEDVSVREGHEGRGVGSALVRRAVKTAREFGCYKCVLDCKEDVVPFYERLGFRRHEIAMRKDLK